MPIIGAKGSPSSGGFGQFAQAATAANYIEDVFSTWLYTGTGASQTIVNGIDASTKGALFWIKSRNAAEGHRLTDTVRGPNFHLSTDFTGGQDNDSNRSITATTSGFTTGPTSSSPNSSGTNYVAWTLAEQSKFFEILTYTGNGVIGREIPYTLGGNPGAVIIKSTSTSGPWDFMIRNNAGTEYGHLVINTTAAQDFALSNSEFLGTGTIKVAIDSGVRNMFNANGVTYVMYLFAHNAGGFGLTGTDNVISCGSFVWGNTGTQTVNLGYEPQWILCKQSTGVDGWFMFDTMRNDSLTGQNYLLANSSAAEAAGTGRLYPTATGFAADPGGGNQTYIYIAIRRGPMKVPTTGTSVFSPQLSVGTTGQQVATGFPVDLQLFEYRPGGGNNYAVDRLRGISSNTTETSRELFTNTTGAESTSNVTRFWNNTGYQQPSFGNVAGGYINWNFRRAPGFFDETCWIGNGSGVTVNHNLTVAPELIILKSRSASANWVVRPPGAGSFYLNLNNTNASTSGGGNFINNPTATTFSTGDDASVNTNGVTYVAYLFATCAGVSKVGTYTGTGSTLTVDCGFASGARFVMIKRSSGSGNWFVWDTARGMVAGTDPRLALNTTAAEANSDWVYTVAGGFQLVEFDNINISGSTYIFLAIA
jgi:hypothetical protein